MLINFWWFLSDFHVNWVKNSGKLDFAIKNHCFLSFFDMNFDQFLVIFDTFLGSFLGFLGGYPSPSISAPLVVKKCPKLYIYNIGYPPTYDIPHIYHGAPFSESTQNAQNAKMHKLTNLKCKIIKCTKMKHHKIHKTGIPVQRGENENLQNYDSMWISPTSELNIKK